MCVVFVGFQTNLQQSGDHDGIVNVNLKRMLGVKTLAIFIWITLTEKRIAKFIN